MSKKVLYLVHCVDTEGPLHETLAATSERLAKTFGLQVELTPEKLASLQRGEGLADSLRQAVMDFISPKRLAYNRNWAEIDAMISNLMSPEWRMKYADDFGNGYVFSWFIIDHVGYTTNPRHRALGFHSVYEFYEEQLRLHRPPQDRLYWHFHPMSYFHEANKTSNNFGCCDNHLQVFSRRIIDKLDFPVAFRPGSHVERPDINLFLEMWIPFDYGNQGMPERQEDARQKDISGGRYGDWRRATATWEVYHPDFYDYQLKGSMRRYIARCLNLESRVRPITEEEIHKAFARTSEGLPTILSVTNHDEREMRDGIDWFMTTVRKVQQEYPDVAICHVNAVDAIRLAEGMQPQNPTRLDFVWNDNRLEIRADKYIWGPQPYFCFKTKDKRYLHENLDYHGGQFWSFVFDEDFITLDQIEYIGIATNDRYGNTSVYRLTPDRDLNATASAFRNSLCANQQSNRVINA